MKNIKVTDTKIRLNQNDINMLEEKLAVALPNDYKKFLLLHNGGHPEKNT